MVSRWAPRDVAELEITPDSNGRKTVVAEIIDAQSEQDRKALTVLAEALGAELKMAPDRGTDKLEFGEGDLGVESLKNWGVTGSGNFVVGGKVMGIEPVNPWPPGKIHK